VCSPGRKGHDDLTSSPPSSSLSLAVSFEFPAGPLATLVLCCQQAFGCWGLIGDCRGQLGGRWGWRQVIMPLMSRASRMLQWPVQRAAIPWGGANPKKPVSVRIGVCNSTPWSRSR